MKDQFLLIYFVLLLYHSVPALGLSTVTNVKTIDLDSWSYRLLSFACQHYIEIFGVLFILFYICYFIWGMKKNERIAKSWLNEYIGLFKEQFTSVGISGKNHLFINVSHDEYRFFCSGRIHCLGLLADCKMKKRQDFYSFLIELISPVEDILTIDVPFEPQTSSPFVFALCRKQDARVYYNQLKDLKDLAHKISSQFIPELSKLTNEYVVYCDNNEIPSQIVNEQLVSLLKQDNNYFRLIHITDKRGDNTDGSILLIPPFRILLFSLDMLSLEEIQELRPWMEYIFTLIDMLPGLHLSTQSLTSAVEARTQADLKRNYRPYTNSFPIIRDKKRD